MQPTLSAEAILTATPERIYECYASPATWPDWDPDMQSAALDGPFEAGSRGWIKPQGAPRLATCLLETNRPHGFTAECRMPGCRLRFVHQLEPLSASDSDEARTRVVHSVVFVGLLAGVYRRLLGPRLQASLEPALSGLQRYLTQ